MALWNNLSKKVSNTRDKTVQQAKILTETTRLYAVIAEEKKKIEANYSKLGMQYAQIHHDDYEEAFAEVMGAILASEKLIQDSQMQILGYKGVRCCENCGAELPKDAAFCSSCGAVVPKPKAPAGNFCTGCGAALIEGARFCTICGTPVLAAKAPEAEAPAADAPAAEEPATEAPAAEEPATEAPAAEEPATEAPAAEEPATEAPVAEEAAAEVPAEEEAVSMVEERRCPQCGAALEEDMVFCTSCGCKL